MRIISLFAFLLCLSGTTAQNFLFNFNTTGQRVCLVSAEVDLETPSVTIKLLDAAANSNQATSIYRRALYGNGTDWINVASNLPAGTTQWVDTNVAPGEVWEYQVKRTGTWFYASQTWNATGYAVGSLLADKTDYQGQMILLVADNIVNNLPQEYTRLKKELTGEGWLVNEIVVPKATSWDSGNAVVGIKSQIVATHALAPINDKPKILFILGHVPMPRSGSSSVTAPDGHDQNKGARGCDGYYADINGVFTDAATFNPGGLQTALAINIPGDFKWDPDFLPSELEMAFGRVDFEDVDDVPGSEIAMMETYLDKLSNYKNVAPGFDMGDKSGFYLGYDNSNDGSYRTLPNISKAADVYQNTTGTPHPQWVQNNGPFKIYMQNRDVPNIAEWNTYGMNATVFSSDQSYWGFNDVPQNNYIYSRIRALLATNTKCLVTLWTTTGVNFFYQACSGDALGLAVKEIMDHNADNDKLEKPLQEWDTPDWWNRTHFAYNGDPTLRLYQTKAASNPIMSNIGNQAILSWDAAEGVEIVGYHVYKSATEFGKYIRVTPVPIALTTYVDDEYLQNDWYMVRSVSIATSGCGLFYNAGQGVFAKGDFLLSVPAATANQLTISPNPASHFVTVTSGSAIEAVVVLNAQGRTICRFENIWRESFAFDVTGFATGVYFLKISDSRGFGTKKFVVH